MFLKDTSPATMRDAHFPRNNAQTGLEDPVDLLHRKHISILAFAYSDWQFLHPTTRFRFGKTESR
jgi:hypothetical protein